MLGTEAQHELVMANMGLAGHWAHRYSDCAPGQYADIYQEACTGLCEAAAKYEPDKQKRFVGYATYAIRWRIWRWLRARHGVNGEKRTTRILAVERDRRDYLHDHRERPPEKKLEDADYYQAVLRGLDPMRQQILRLIYEDRLTERVAGERLAITQQRVHQLHWNTIQRLKRKARKELA